MTKTMEMNEFLKQFEEEGIFASNISELENILSKEFSKLVGKLKDAQLAFDELDAELGGLLDMNSAVYSLSKEGEPWKVGISNTFKVDKLEKYLDKFRTCYREDFNTLDGMLSKLYNRVIKDMCNAGCDAKSALQMILTEDLLLEGEFVIVGADAEPRISFMDFHL